MANSKFYTVTKEIKGKTYKAQFNGLSYVIEAHGRDLCQRYVQQSQQRENVGKAFR